MSAETATVVKIFISHSSKSARGKEALEYFCTGLTHVGHEVLIDYNIYAGDKWNDEILDAIYTCDVAIVLLTLAAVGTSSWVSPHISSYLRHSALCRAAAHFLRG